MLFICYFLFCSGIKFSNANKKPKNVIKKDRNSNHDKDTPNNIRSPLQQDSGRNFIRIHVINNGTIVKKATPHIYGLSFLIFPQTV